MNTAVPEDFRTRIKHMHAEQNKVLKLLTYLPLLFFPLFSLLYPLRSLLLMIYDMHPIIWILLRPLGRRTEAKSAESRCEVRIFQTVAVLLAAPSQRQGADCKHAASSGVCWHVLLYSALFVSSLMRSWKLNRSWLTLDLWNKVLISSYLMYYLYELNGCASSRTMTE